VTTARHLPNQSRRPREVYLSVAEIATELRVSKMSVYRLIRDGTLPAGHVGHTLRVREKDFEAFLRTAWDWS
jgi:excisionase family DNA binding protein